MVGQQRAFPGRIAAHQNGSGAVAWPKPGRAPGGAARPGIAAALLGRARAGELLRQADDRSWFASVAGTRVTTWAVIICPF